MEVEAVKVQNVQQKPKIERAQKKFKAVVEELDAQIDPLKNERIKLQRCEKIVR